MRNIKYALPLAALVTSTVYAQDYSRTDVVGRSFAGIMAGQLELSDDAIGEDFNFVTATARVGHDFNRFFGLELRGGTSVDDDEFMGVDIDIPYFVSALTRVGWLPVDGNRIGVYGLVGYSVGELEVEFRGVSADDTADGISFGVGAELLANEHSGINLEYARLLDEEIEGEEVEVSHIGIGYVYRF